MRRLSSALFVTCLLLCARVASAASYTEAANGDLSNNRLAPTSFALDPGANTLSASSIVGDPEYFRVTVPPGSVLSAVRLTAFASGTNVAFIAVQSGTTFSCAASGAGACGAANLLGYAHFGASLLGTDMLDNIGQGAASTTFTPPLTAGDYTFWAQETAASASSYTLELIVSTPSRVPLPPPFMALIGLGLSAIGARLLRR